MAKIPSYTAASVLDGTEELIGVQSAASVKLTPAQLRSFIYSPVYKSAAYTALSNEVIYADSAIASFTVTLPIAPSTGDYVGVWDCGDNATTNAITIARNGNTINGQADDFIINMNGGRWDAIYNGTTWEYSYVLGGLNGTLSGTYKDAAYTAVARDIVYVGSDTGAITITLPASPNTDDVVGVSDVDGNAAANNITVARNGNTIDGAAADFTIDIDFGQAHFIWTGTTWKHSLVSIAGRHEIYKSAAYTAVDRDVVYADSSGAAFTVTLPVTPNTNDVVTVYDAAGSAAVNNITIGRNGETINGVAQDYVLNLNWGQISLIYDGTNWLIAISGSPQPLESFMVAVSDETTDLTTGTAKVTIRMPYAFTLVGLPRASVNTAPTGTGITVDVNEGGVSIFSTLLTIDATEKTSTTATTPCVVSDVNLADDAEITFDIDVIGSTIAGKGLKIILIGRKT